jgi:NADH-quinone oxidoreductase subunit L
MAGEQDMRRMGGLKRYLPVTYMTMLIGTLAIAGIPPLAGFFSKDEILFRTFLTSKVVWTLAVATALMTAFYMFRLMSMTFLGTYRGPAWDDQHAGHGGAHADSAAAHGHGAWHGPHESPSPMTVPLMALAVGAIVAGFVGIPAALGGANSIERFLEPSFTAQVQEAAAGESVVREGMAPAAAQEAAAEGAAEAEGEGGGVVHMSRAGEIGLMVLSVLIGVVGIWLAYRFYVRSPEISERLAERWAWAHTVLSNKYYVDELYAATVVKGTMGSARGLWAVDRNVIDGAVNGSGWITVFSSWLSGLFDLHVVDGLVNLVGGAARAASFVFRRVQTGLVQNYALVMVFGVFAFVSIYLLVR